jgi:hypothetical protein
MAAAGIWNLVAQSHRGQGEVNGHRYLLAEILHANKPAQRLVRKLGFHALPSNFDPKVMCFVKELEPSGRSVVAGAKSL